MATPGADPGRERDRALARRILSGEEAAFRELYEAEKRRLLRTAWYFLGDDPEAEDVVQDAFVKALRALPGFRYECALSTWLNHIAANLCRDRLEKRKKTAILSPEEFAVLPSKEGKREAYPAEALAALREEIGKMDGREGELLRLREMESLSYEKIAARLGLPLGTVTSGLHRARLALVERVRARLGLTLKANEARPSGRGPEGAP